MSTNNMPKSLLQATRYFADPDVCVDFVAAMRWPTSTGTASDWPRSTFGWPTKGRSVPAAGHGGFRRVKRPAGHTKMR